MSGAAHLLDDFMTRIDRYDEQRNFPGVKGPSYLSTHLRFGTVSIRSLVRTAHALTLRPHGGGASTWLSELIWREFSLRRRWQKRHDCEFGLVVLKSCGYENAIAGLSGVG